MRNLVALVCVSGMLVGCGKKSTSSAPTEEEKKPTNTAAASPDAATAVEAELDPFVKQHLDIALALCASTAVEPWCSAARGFAAGRAEMPKAGTRLGLTTFVQTNGATHATLEELTHASAFAVSGDGKGWISGVKASSGTQVAETARVKSLLVDLFAERPVTIEVDQELGGYLDSLPGRAPYSLALHPNGLHIEGGSNANVRRVGDRWVSIEVPRNNPAGIYFSVFADVPYSPQSGGPQGGDLSQADLDGFKSRLTCDDPVQSGYCAALDQFAAADYPTSLVASFYPGRSLTADFVSSTPEVGEEASYLIVLETQAQYDTIIPLNDEEKAQVATYLDFFHRGGVPPATDPVVSFASTLSTAKVVPTKRAGKSLHFERHLENAGMDNPIYVRETADALIVVETGPPVTNGKLFFVGIFPKSLKITPPR